MRIELLTPDTAAVHEAALGRLLRDAVEHGASVGFVLPLDAGEVQDYWRRVIAEMATGHKLLWAAFDDAGWLVGSAQLALEPRANGRHRAEAQKVMVLASHRGRGLGAALMAAVEAEAKARDRTLLHLDTSEGRAGAREFYDRLGYTLVGGIPDFAANPNGALVPNAIFYKRLG